MFTEEKGMAPFFPDKNGILRSLSRRNNIETL